jgi:hypothetical protein
MITPAPTTEDHAKSATTPPAAAQARLEPLPTTPAISGALADELHEAEQAEERYGEQIREAARRPVGLD